MTKYRVTITAPNGRSGEEVEIEADSPEEAVQTVVDAATFQVSDTFVEEI